MLAHQISEAEHKIKSDPLTPSETIVLSKLVNEGRAATRPPHESGDIKELSFHFSIMFNDIWARIYTEAQKKKKRDEYAKLLADVPPKLQKFIPLSPDAFYELLNDEALHESSTEILFNKILAHIKKHEGKSAEAGERGGAVTLESKQPFIEKYRAKRDQACDASRASLVEKLQPTYPLRTETLMRWAKEADKKDNFVRKAGRHRNK